MTAKPSNARRLRANGQTATLTSATDDTSNQPAPPDQTANTNAKPWGFLHPECHGRNALLFFSWDLARAIEEQFVLHEASSLEIRVAEAQKAVDRLLNQYVQIQANADAFEGQSITLSLQTDPDHPDTPVLALQTSPHLEQLILEVQAEQTPRSVN